MADLTLIIFLSEEDTILPPMRQYHTVLDQPLEACFTAMLGEEEPTPPAQPGVPLPPSQLRCRNLEPAGGTLFSSLRGRAVRGPT